MLAEQFAALTTGVLTHKRRIGISEYLSPSYSTEVTYPAYYEAANRVVTDAQGNEVMSRGRIYVVSTSASIDPEDWLAMNGSTDPLRAINVNPFNDLDGQHHIEIDV